MQGFALCLSRPPPLPLPTRGRERVERAAAVGELRNVRRHPRACPEDLLSHPLLYPIACRPLWQILGTSPRMTVRTKGPALSTYPLPPVGRVGVGVSNKKLRSTIRAVWPPQPAAATFSPRGEGSKGRTSCAPSYHGRHPRACPEDLLSHPLLYPIACCHLWQILGTSPRMTVRTKGSALSTSPSPLWGGPGWGSHGKKGEAPLLTRGRLSQGKRGWISGFVLVAEQRAEVRRRAKRVVVPVVSRRPSPFPSGQCSPSEEQNGRSDPFVSCRPTITRARL